MVAERAKQQLEEILAEGQARYPAVKAPREKLTRQLHEALSQREGPVRHPAELYLARACLTGSPSALGVLEQEVLGQLPRMLGRALATGDFAEEVLQRVRIHLVSRAPPALAQYDGSHPLLHWARAVTLRLALNAKREARREVAAGDEVGAELPFLGESAELAVLRRELRPQFARAFKDAVRALAREERNALRLHFVEGLTLEALAAHFQVHRATVARWIASARKQVLQRTREALGEVVEPQQLAAVVSLLRSGLDSSIRRALQSERRSR